jgi:hypothetical protein
MISYKGPIVLSFYAALSAQQPTQFLDNNKKSVLCAARLDLNSQSLWCIK